MLISSWERWAEKSRYYIYVVIKSISGGCLKMYGSLHSVDGLNCEISVSGGIVGIVYVLGIRWTDLLGFAYVIIIIMIYFQPWPQQLNYPPHCLEVMDTFQARVYNIVLNVNVMKFSSSYIAMKKVPRV